MFKLIMVYFNMNKTVLLSRKKLKDLRNKKKLSQEGLCDEFYYADIKISLATIKRAELGMKVTRPVAQILSNFYKIPVEHLIDLAPSHQPQPKSYQKNRCVFMIKISSSESTANKNTSIELTKRNILTFLSENQFAIIDVEKKYIIGYSLLKNKNSILARVTKFQQTFMKTKSSLMLSLCIQELAVSLLGSHIEIPSNDLEDFKSILNYFDGQKVLLGSKFIQVENSNLFFTEVDFSLHSGTKFWEGVIKNKGAELTFGRDAELNQFSALIEDYKKFKKSIAVNLIGSSGSGKTHLCKKLKGIAKFKFGQNSVVDIQCQLGESINQHILIEQLIQLLLRSCVSLPFSEQKEIILKLKAEKKWEEINPRLLINLSKSGDLVSYKNFSLNSLAMVIENLLQLSPVKVLSIDDLHLADKVDMNILNTALGKLTNKKIIIIYVTSQHIVLPIKFANLQSVQFNLSLLSDKNMQKLASFWFTRDLVFRDSCVATAKGNPLCLNQLLCKKSKSRTQLFSPTPLLKMRINALSERQKLMIYYAALYGIKVSIQVMKELLIDAVDLLNFLAHVGLINFTDMNFIRFRDQKVRSSIIETIPFLAIKFLHKKITNALLYLEIIDTRSDHIRLSYHFEHHADIKNAIEHCYQAALIGNLECTYELSMIDLRKALVLLVQMPNLNQEIKIRELQISLFRVRYGCQSIQVNLIFNILESLIKRKNIRKPLSLEFASWIENLTSLKLKNSLMIAKNMYKSSLENDYFRALSSMAMGTTLFFIGDLNKSIDHLIPVLNNYKSEFYKKEASQFGIDSRVIANFYLILNLILQGKFTKAEHYLYQLSLVVKDTKNQFSLAMFLFAQLFISFFLENTKECEKISIKLLDCGKKNGFVFFIGIAKIFNGWSIAKLGGLEKGIDSVIEGYEKWILNSDCKIGYSLYCCQLTEILILDRQEIRALAIIKKGIKVSYENNEHVFLSRMYHLKAIAEKKLFLPVFIITNSLSKGGAIAEKQNATLFQNKIKEDNSIISISNMSMEEVKVI